MLGINLWFRLHWGNLLVSHRVLLRDSEQWQQLCVWGERTQQIMRHVGFCNRILCYIYMNCLTKLSVFQFIQNPYFIFQLTPITYHRPIAGLLGGRAMLMRLAIQQELSNDLPDKIRIYIYIYIYVCVCVCVWCVVCLCVWCVCFVCVLCVCVCGVCMWCVCGVCVCLCVYGVI